MQHILGEIAAVCFVSGMSAIKGVGCLESDWVGPLDDLERTHDEDKSGWQDPTILLAPAYFFRI